MLAFRAALAVGPAGGVREGLDEIHLASLGLDTRRGRKRLVHDPPDGAGTAAALGAAAEAAINLTGAARAIGGVQRRPHIRVAEHVARADDHVDPASQTLSTFCNYR